MASGQVLPEKEGMLIMSSNATVRQLVLDRFRKSGLEPAAVEVKSFPGETIVVVEVEREHDRAVDIARELDAEIESGFVTVRQAPSRRGSQQRDLVSSVHDERIPRLIELMNARARTSEAQPSLRYVEDVAERKALAVSPRHHLVFGRRGVGKTALLLEAKKQLEKEGALTLWVNMHTLRDFKKEAAFLTIALRLCDLGVGALRGGGSSAASSLLDSVRASLGEAQAENATRRPRVSTFVPQLQHAIARLCATTAKPLYIFLDDIHYMNASEVPGLLDLLHGISRDNPVWLKIAGIRHQTRWFTPDPPVGLQTGQDASIINLDITLEQPSRAKTFLRNILLSYVEESDAEPLRSFLSGAALDRLVLACGGVPRDFLLLCVGALQIARQRKNASTVGVQDVNHAAGAAAQTKLQELEDDAAAARGRSRDLVSALESVKNFLLEERQITFLSIDFLDKERHPRQYALMQGLMDLRMLHLINSSISDDHHAGRRSEVYLLDLSQYSGTRLKRNLRVLDFVKDHLVLKKTQGDEVPRVGDTPRKLVDLLRRGPNFRLSLLSGILANPKA
jgi:AAA ATPase-like protein